MISHVADTYAQVRWTLLHSDSTEHRHQAARRFAQIQQDSSNFIEEIRALRVGLPPGWRGIGLDRPALDAGSAGHRYNHTHFPVTT